MRNKQMTRLEAKKDDPPSLVTLFRKQGHRPSQDNFFSYKRFKASQSEYARAMFSALDLNRVVNFFLILKTLAIVESTGRVTLLSDLTKQQAARIKKRTLFMSSLMSNPSTTAVPDVMVSSPVNMRNVVVFPAPLIPRRPKHSLMGTPRHRLSTAVNGERPGEKSGLFTFYLHLVSFYLINYIHDNRDHLRWFQTRD